MKASKSRIASYVKARVKRALGKRGIPSSVEEAYTLKSKLQRVLDQNTTPPLPERVRVGMEFSLKYLGSLLDRAFREEQELRLQMKDIRDRYRTYLSRGEGVSAPLALVRGPDPGE